MTLISRHFPTNRVGSWKLVPEIIGLVFYTLHIAGDLLGNSTTPGKLRRLPKTAPPTWSINTPTSYPSDGRLWEASCALLRGPSRILPPLPVAAISIMHLGFSISSFPDNMRHRETSTFVLRFENTCLRCLGVCTHTHAHAHTLYYEKKSLYPHRGTWLFGPQKHDQSVTSGRQPS